MTCKHRWEQVTYIKHIKPNRYMYICARCNKFITTLLKEKEHETKIYSVT